MGKAEAFAIFYILLLCPRDSSVVIYTDSQSTIQVFNPLSSPSLTDRRFQKINNCHIWSAIKQLLTTLHLSVTLNKVKAHSTVFNNDQVDALAKLGGTL